MESAMDRLHINWSGKRIRTVFLTGLLVLAPSFAIAERVGENPSIFRMLGDLLVARPLGWVVATVGTAVFIFSLPVSVLGGNADEAAQKMVVDPAKEVFMGCLGCSTSGKKEKIKNEN